MKKNIASLIGLVFTGLLSAAPQQVQAGWMEDFYLQAGAGVNVTAPAAIHTQNTVGFSGGGVNWRVPNTTINPIQITPPQVRAGCGGIDLFLGGYSFVNKAQFVTALRNFGQAAVGYFFQLALRSMAPEVAVTLDAINDVAQKVNQFGANSCQAAQNAIDGLAGDFFKTHQREAAGYAQAVGEFVDRFDATMGMQTGGGRKVYQERYLQKYGKPQSDLTTSDVCSAKGVDVNAIYWVMCNARLSLSDDERNLVMSFFGASYIIKGAPDPDGDTGTIEDGYGPTISLKDLVGHSGDTSAYLDILTCANTECTILAKIPQVHRPFTTIVEDALARIEAAITSRSAITFDAQTETVLKLSSVPLWRVAGLSATSGLGAAAAVSMRKDLAEIAGLEAAVNFMRHYLDQVDRALVTSGSKLPEGLKGKEVFLHKRVAELRQDAVLLQQQVYEKHGNPWQKLDQLERIERAMFSNLNQQLAANQRFNNRH